jgi:hypothetical protein
MAGIIGWIHAAQSGATINHFASPGLRQQPQWA